MYAQFFGSYLLSKNIVTPKQLTEAISHLSEAHIKLGTLAMHKGYMTAEEVNEVCFLQTREDKHFGQIALERNYLFEDQLNELLNTQSPDYLLLGQNLVDMGAITNNQLEELLLGYRDENQLNSDMEANELPEESMQLVDKFFEQTGRPLPKNILIYMNLLFNNLVRFIGSDFTPLTPVFTNSYDTNFCITQQIKGFLPLLTALDMEPETAITFASRYAKMEFDEFNEYVKASLEDFINLHNGLFSVNMSNTYSKEAELDPPGPTDEDTLELSDDAFVVPIIYPFGTIYFAISGTGDASIDEDSEESQE
ncbi:MAG: chemotaxis protein CheX [Lachnospiraceae bacterium]|uniref:Chemotaxis protein CheX n=1 Tax=Candidatus Weimeria bifida TaxID=2599074 RepID=A0A6N7J024_9FIRM|nr:chemotaxis protein CheX [Candidatus Weimeria bifida]RRF97162.1 MAG: chemotaxis protein CheX [Lachnospiraceae bacterium]